jgi:hypothetical protein
MSKLLAPNGKPSNLNPEQYKLVRTPAFKKWFGDWENDPQNASKVIDENGEPLVVYHGTKNQFNIFKEKGNGNRVLGYFFTDNKDFSEIYGETKLYFLNIKNIEIYSGKKFDELNTKENIKNGYWDKEKQKLLKDSYNGILIDRNDFFAGFNIVRKDFVPFEPNQIKLADGTNTTFDENNPDIRYEQGGKTYSNTEKLIVELKKHSDYKKGIENFDKETGQKYRQDRYILKYPFASYWLVKLWEKAAEENGDKNARNFIYNNKYSFAFDRGKFKGERDGKIRLLEEIELNDDYKQGGKVKKYWYKGLFS